MNQKNKGFTLVEVLIAMTILSIIVVPLMNAFVTSAKVNAKSKRVLDATNLAQNYIEEIKASSLEEVAKQFNEKTTEGYFIEKKTAGYINDISEQGSSVDDNGNFTGQASGEYEFKVEGAAVGDSEYDVTIRLTASDVATQEDGTKTGHTIANVNSMDETDCAYYTQSDEMDQKAAYEFRTRNAAYVYSAPEQEDTAWFLKHMKRTISITLNETLEAGISITTAEISYSYTLDSEAKSYVENPTYTITKKVYDEAVTGEELEAVYLYYYPVDNTLSDREEIVINNMGNMEKDIFLIVMDKVSENGSNLISTPKITVNESRGPGQPDPYVNICTNIDLDSNSIQLENISKDDFNKNLVNEESTASLYDIEIEVYKGSNLIETYEASFLDSSQVK